MVRALLELDENTNRVLNVVKAKFALKDKSEAVEVLVNHYIETEKDPELRPEFIKTINRIKEQRSIAVEDFAKRYNIQTQDKTRS